MVKGEIGVTKDIRVYQENLEDLEDLVVKGSLVMILKEHLVRQESLVSQERMEKMAILVHQEEMELKEIKEREIFPRKILWNTGKSCLNYLRLLTVENVVIHQDITINHCLYYMQHISYRYMRILLY